MGNILLTFPSTQLILEPKGKEGITALRWNDSIRLDE
jgi:hypothetical protein